MVMGLHFVAIKPDTLVQWGGAALHGLLVVRGEPGLWMLQSKVVSRELQPLTARGGRRPHISCLCSGAVLRQRPRRRQGQCGRPRSRSQGRNCLLSSVTLEHAQQRRQGHCRRHHSRPQVRSWLCSGTVRRQGQVPSPTLQPDGLMQTAAPMEAFSSSSAAAVAARCRAYRLSPRRVPGRSRAAPRSVAGGQWLGMRSRAAQAATLRAHSPAAKAGQRV